MLRVLGVLLAALSVAGCGFLAPPPSASLTAALPKTIGGQPVVYSEHAASEMGPQLIFFQQPIETVGGSLDTARVAIGLGRDGFTLTALRVPGADARRLLDPIIEAADFKPTARAVAVVGGKDATILTLPLTTRDRAYVYASGDTIVVLTTSQPALAVEALRSLP